MNKYFLLFILLIPIKLLGSNENRPAGARSDGIGKASVAIIDTWASFHNQASLALLKKKSFGAYYENRFQSKELSTKAFCFNFPSKLGTFSLNYTQFGFNLYKESKIGISYARALGQHFWAGLQFDQIKKELNAEYGSQTKYTFELGLLAEIFPDFFLGFHLFNPTQEEFTTWEYSDEIPTIGRFGFSWKFSNGAILSSEILKDLDNDIQIKGGIEYPVNKQFFIRAGAYNHPNSISLGLGFNFSLIKTNIAFSRHPVLGYTPSADLSITF